MTTVLGGSNNDQTRLESFPTWAILLWEVPVRTPDRPTIADVAALAGVGTGTVSRVLNGGLHVSEAESISRIGKGLDDTSELGGVDIALTVPLCREIHDIYHP